MKPVIFLTLLPFLALGLWGKASTEVRSATFHELRDFAPLITAWENGEEIDPTELAYVLARSVALLTAISKYLDESSSGESLEKDVSERHKAMGDVYAKRASSFYEFAIVYGLAAGKTVETVDQQIVVLLDVYFKEMVRSMQLNNVLLNSATIGRDFTLVKKLATIINTKGLPPHSPAQRK
jgi:hypothetical protein